MAELKCPHCGQAFTVDDTELSSIVQQIRDSEFEKDLHKRLAEMQEKAPEDGRLFACVLDMDNLKFINDTYGHSEGDFGIMSISEITKKLAKKNEICVRAGGDEFYIIGIDSYPEHEGKDRCMQLQTILSELSQQIDKPYPISASIGCSLGAVGDFALTEILEKADQEMYRQKTEHKKQRLSS